MTEISKIKIDNNDLLIKDAIARNNIESLSTNINNNYLPLTGGSLNGILNLTANEDKTSSVYLRLYSGNGYGFIQARSSSTDYQSNLLVQGGGNLLIGSGESCQSMWSNNIQNAANNTKNLFLNSDTNIYINTNVQTTTAVKTWTFNNSGDAVFPGSLTLNTPLTQQNGGTGVSTATVNYVFAAPSDSNGEPSFRKLVANDIPDLNASKITAGFLAVACGGTGVATANANTIFAGPSSGNAAAPSFRALNTADLPTLSLNNLKSDASFLIAKSGSVTRKLHGLHLICWNHDTHGGIGVVDGWSGVNIFYDSASTKIIANLDTDTYTITNNYTGYSNMRYLIINFNESTQ